MIVFTIVYFKQYCSDKVTNGFVRYKIFDLTMKNISIQQIIRYAVFHESCVNYKGRKNSDVILALQN